MPYTVLKISKSSADEIDVAGEFTNEEDARKFVESARVDAEMHGNDEDYDFLVEAPPTMIQ